MNGALRIVELDALRAVLMPEAVIAAVRDALIRHARGEVLTPAPVQMLFERPAGDCHVKAGRFRDGEHFLVKIATGFYENPDRGLPVNDGLVLIFNAQTGVLDALIRDHGWLTSWRTAAAGALAAEAGLRPGTAMLGIVGTGHQARLQAEWATRHLGIDQVMIFGRSTERANALAADLCNTGLKASAASSIEALCESCRLLITCTPSNEVILRNDIVQPGTHIVALGADSPGKQELDPLLFGRASVIMVDDLEQCADHGDLSHALRAGLVKTGAVVALGSVLAGGHGSLYGPSDITISDLTGVAAEDLAIASLALSAVAF